MALNFPTSPSVNDVHTEGSRSWVWNGVSWLSQGAGRAQVNLDGATVLQGGKDNFDTVSEDTDYTHTASPSNGMVTNLNLIVTEEVTIGFPACRRAGSDGLIIALLVPAGNHELSFKRILGEWWLADSCGDVTETPADSTAPTVSSRTINSAGTQLSIVFNEAVDFGAGGNGGFALTMTGGAVAASYASGAGTNTLVYTLSRTIASGETGTLAYTQPTDGVQDDTELGNDLATFAGQAITNNSTVDVTPPTLTSATIDAAGTSLTLLFNEIVNIGAGGNGGFVVTMSGGASALTYASGAGSNTLVYTLARTIEAGETGTLAYTQPGNGVEDAAGNDLATIGSAAVTNNAGGGSFTPADLPNLETWLTVPIAGGVDGTALAAWPDSSANADDFSQANTEARPTYETAETPAGTAAVKFAAVGAQAFNVTAASASNIPVTLWAVVKFSDTAANRTIFGTESDGGLFFYLAPSSPEAVLVLDKRNVANIGLATTGIAAGGWHLVVAVITSTTWEFFVDGVSVGSGSHSVTFDASKTLQLGATNHTANYMDGFIADAGMCAAAIDGTQRASLLAWSQAEYGTP